MQSRKGEFAGRYVPSQHLSTWWEKEAGQLRDAGFRASHQEGTVWPWIIGLGAAALVVAGIDYLSRHSAGTSLSNRIFGRFGPEPEYFPNDLSPYLDVLPPTESGVAAV